MTDRNNQAIILCVDDDPELTIFYQTCLNKSNYKLVTAESYEEGLKLSQKLMPDIVLCRLIIAGCTGYEFCRKFRSIPIAKEMVFVMVYFAADVDCGDLTKIKEDIDDFLIKPEKKEEFLVKIMCYLNMRLLKNDYKAVKAKSVRAEARLKQYKKELKKNTKELKDEKKMLNNSLDQISLMTKERKRINIELDTLRRKYRNDSDNFISVLSEILQSKRQYHSGHLKKVAEISEFIAKEMGLEKKHIKNIKNAGLLHEIGKIAIPDKLAMKNPEKYSQREKNLLLLHPVRGAALIEKFVEHKKISCIIRHLNERYDGKGVPDGLKGNEIPIGSRIISVANFFDKLIFRKNNNSSKKAMEKVNDKVGTIFDPVVAHFFHKYIHLHLSDEIGEVKELNIFELESGMLLTSDIISSQGIKLLPQGMVLTDESLYQISQFNRSDPIFETVFIKG